MTTVYGDKIHNTSACFPVSKEGYFQYQTKVKNNQLQGNAIEGSKNITSLLYVMK